MSLLMVPQLGTNGCSIPSDMLIDRREDFCSIPTTRSLFPCHQELLIIVQPYIQQVVHNSIRRVLPTCCKVLGLPDGVGPQLVMMRQVQEPMEVLVCIKQQTKRVPTFGGSLPGHWLVPGSIRPKLARRNNELPPRPTCVAVGYPSCLVTDDLANKGQR